MLIKNLRVTGSTSPYPCKTSGSKNCCIPSQWSAVHTFCLYRCLGLLLNLLLNQSFFSEKMLKQVTEQSNHLTHLTTPAGVCISFEYCFPVLIGMRGSRLLQNRAAFSSEREALLMQIGGVGRRRSRPVAIAKHKQPRETNSSTIW